MQHIPADAPYLCPSPHCKATIVPGDSPPDARMTNDKQAPRRAKEARWCCTMSAAFHKHPSLRLYPRCPPLDFACRSTFVSANHSSQCQQGHNGEGCLMDLRQVRCNHQRSSCPTNGHRPQEAQHVGRIMAWQRLQGNYGLVS